MLQKVEGIVIRTNDYGETNKIVTLYTRENGKVGVMARGAKKPKSRLSSISQLFTYGQFLFRISKGLGSLSQGEVISTMRGLREELFSTAYAAYVVELMDRLTEEKEPNPYLFEMLLQTLQYMNEGLDLDILLNIYEVKMLSVAGIHPKLDGCAICQRQEGQFVFSIREAGFLCQSCYQYDPNFIRINQHTIKLLRLFYHFDLNRLGNISVKDETKAELRLVISAFYDEYSGVYLKSRKFLDQLKNLSM